MPTPRGSRKSAVWNYFDVISEDHVRCNICQTTELKMMPHSSTTNMLTHLRKKHGLDPLKDKGKVDFFDQQMGLEQIEHEQQEQGEPINPLTWLNFGNITDRSARCLMCRQDVELVPDVSQPRIIRHLARKHPTKYRELFGFEPEIERTEIKSANDQLAGNIEDAIMRELHETQRNIFIKSENIEPQEVEVEFLPPNQTTVSSRDGFNEQASISHHNGFHGQASPSHHLDFNNHFTVPALPQKSNHIPSPAATPTFTAQNQNYFGQKRKRSAEKFSPAPHSSRAPSPSSEKKLKFLMDDNNDEFRALGSLVEMELRSVGLKDPFLAMKYQISIQEELTKMKKEMLLKQ